MGLGYVGGVTHAYTRHGTTTLIVALVIAIGAVIRESKARHRHQEFLSFLQRIEKKVHKKLDLHLIVDNYAPTGKPGEGLVGTPAPLASALNTYL